MILKKMQEGCKIRRTYRIFGYTRRDKFFIFVGVGVFHPLSRRIVSTTHAPLRVQKHAAISHHPNGVGGKTSATAPRTVRPELPTGLRRDDSEPDGSGPALPSRRPRFSGLSLHKLCD